MHHLPESDDTSARGDVVARRRGLGIHRDAEPLGEPWVGAELRESSTHAGMSKTLSSPPLDAMHWRWHNWQLTKLGK